jgi:hypothetical protein
VGGEHGEAAARGVGAVHGAGSGRDGGRKGGRGGEEQGGGEEAASRRQLEAFARLLTTRYGWSVGSFGVVSAYHDRAGRRCVPVATRTVLVIVHKPTRNVCVCFIRVREK